MSGFKERQDKASATDTDARKIIGAEKQKRDAKTARPKAQHEAAEAAASLPLGKSMKEKR